MAEPDQLYTGTVPSTFGNEDEPEAKVEAMTEQARMIEELMPSVQWVRDNIDDEIDAVSDLRAYIKTLGDNPASVALMAEYRARELYIGYLTRLKEHVSQKELSAKQEVGHA